MGRIQKDLNLDDNKNDEVLYRWFELCMQADYGANLEDVHTFLGQVGR